MYLMCADAGMKDYVTRAKTWAAGATPKAPLIDYFLCGSALFKNKLLFHKCDTNKLFLSKIIDKVLFISYCVQDKYEEYGARKTKMCI